MSKLPFELLLALRYLRPKRTFVSIITLISIVGVALGVAVLIIVISVMSGFDHDLREKILGFNAHLKIFARGTTMQNYSGVMRLVCSARCWFKRSRQIQTCRNLLPLCRGCAAWTSMRKVP